MPRDAPETNVNLREAIAHMTYDTRVKRRARASERPEKFNKRKRAYIFKNYETLKKTDRYQWR